MIDCNATLDSIEALKALSDEDVMVRAKQLMQLKRTVTASALMHVGEMEARGMPPDFDAWSWTNEDPSVFLRAARVLRELPCVCELFQESEFSLSSVAALDVLLQRNARSEIGPPDDAEPPDGERPNDEIQCCPSGPERYQLAFTVERALYEKLKCASDLLSEDGEEVPLEEVLVLALDMLFDHEVGEA